MDHCENIHKVHTRGNEFGFANVQMIALLADEQGPELIGEILAIGSFGF